MKNKNAQYLIASLASLLMAMPVWSQSETAGIAQQPVSGLPSASSQLLQILLALGLVIAMIYALAWFLKRFSKQGSLANSPIKIISSTSMGTREKIVLAEVNGQQLLLGVTAHSINTLQSFDKDDLEELELNQNRTEAVVDFKAKLASLMAVNKKPV
ncbi:flagellar biosynthetic protein FliO [Pseudoteredinibacter isoporae]|uniref:Flagellar protein n=1 Tax=Pseudoteredinibacter isoporae TaxID=570281 RepID=A0A7X0JWE6_9GAMM|nr:flagellar biosynthetic protein FliO [Pseudoteredinibacter isoporae]MBB6523464.1 flagellar protein FliO/FliZ [Pseudoteredinibacter isoporae]NHO88973.1 flagellar biosynthetic protein FliO [Pseudoteredinibacter isoporae]NIB24319.1 flagellar biosynthetic protein FliO [Pseudoteredinibacter isoporae]